MQSLSQSSWPKAGVMMEIFLEGGIPLPMMNLPAWRLNRKRAHPVPTCHLAPGRDMGKDAVCVE